MDKATELAFQEIKIALRYADEDVKDEILHRLHTLSLLDREWTGDNDD